MGGKCKDPSAGTTLGTTVGSTNTEDDCQQLLDYTQNTETDTSQKWAQSIIQITIHVICIIRLMTHKNVIND